MYLLNNLDNEPKQRLTMMLEDNTRLVLTFEYRANQEGWFFGFTYGDNTYQNIRLTTSYNILRAYRNWLPFGLRCDTVDEGEPVGIDDFVTGYAKVYLLTREDVQAIEGNYYAKTMA